MVVKLINSTNKVPLHSQALLLLVLSVLSALVPHLDYLPFWSYMMVCLVLVWRWLVFKGYLSFPGKLVKVVAVMLAMTGVFTLSGGQISLEGSSAFLISAGVLKLLELANRRDSIFVVFIAIFIQATGFLFQQGILYSLHGVFTLMLATAAMISSQAATAHGYDHRVPIFTVSGRLLLLALPFMLIVYFLFPRLGPLWSVALQSGKSITGLSNHINPGGISELSQSPEVAFRVTFDGSRPSQNELYWRAMTFDRHDSSGWEASTLDSIELSSNPESMERSYEYEIIQEPTGKHYLFSLAGAVSSEPEITLTTTRLLRHDRPVYQRIRYRAASEGGSRVGPAFGADRYVPDGSYLQLPDDLNPKTRLWAMTLPQQVDAFQRAFIEYLRNEPFFYTLQPPLYESNDIDQFLFSGRRGFCEHYASAMTFTARAAGIPARLVAGYQGGEWHPDGYLTVRQYDAHAWVELWDGAAWIRVDPTAAIAPDRIEYGIQRALFEEDSFLVDNPLSLHRYRNIGWINQLRQQMDNVNYLWSRWVLSYDGDRQQGLLSRWLGLKQLADGLYLLAGAIAALFIFGTIWQWWVQRPPRQTPLIKAFTKLFQEADSKGIVIKAGTAPLTLLTSIRTSFPELASLCDSCEEGLITSLYKAERTNNPSSGVSTRLLIKDLKRLRLALHRSSSPDAVIERRTSPVQAVYNEMRVSEDPAKVPESVS